METAGDVAPRGSTDGHLTIADLVLIEQFVYGKATPTPREFLLANVAPLNDPDDELNVADLLLIERAVYGFENLPEIDVPPPIYQLAAGNHSGTLVAGAIYEVQGNVTVATGTALTIPAGTTLRFSNAAHGLYVGGALEVQGTAENPVIFTSSSANPVPGDWKGIQINAGVSAVMIDHADIQYADKGILLNDTGTREVTIRNSVIQNNNDGIAVHRDTVAQITGNQIINNDDGIDIDGNADSNPQPVITSNELHSNYSYNVNSAGYLTPGTVVNATGNWWGTTNEMNIAATIRDGQVISDGPQVDFTLYLDGPGGNPVVILDLEGTLTGENTLVAGATYNVLSTVTVASEATLTIPAGTILRFADPEFGLLIDGALTVQGTAANPVVFASANATPAQEDYWWGIEINAGSHAVLIEHAEIRHAGIGISLNETGTRVVTIRNNWLHNNFDGVGVYGDSVAQITDNRIVNNEYGITVFDSYDPNLQPAIAGNELHSNISANAYSDNFLNQDIILDLTGNWWGTTDKIAIAETIYDARESGVGSWVNFVPYLDAPNGTLVGEASLLGVLTENLVLDQGATYDVPGGVLIAPGATLTIPEGTTLRFGDAAYGLHVSGTLNLQGTAENPVIFTSANGAPEPGDWAGIQVNGGTPAVVIDHAEIQYANNGILLNDTGTREVTIRNSVIQNNNNGIAVYRDTVAQITGNQIINNDDGIDIDGNADSDPQPVITGNELHSNNSYNINSADYLTPGTLVDATSNWWGTTDEMSIAETIRDVQVNSDGPLVDFTPYLDGPGGNPIVILDLEGTLTGENLLVAGATYNVLSTVTVASDATLTIPAGTTLHFADPAHGLLIDGALTVQGTAAKPVVLTSSDDESSEKGDWKGIQINSGSGQVLIDHAVIQYANRGIFLNNSDTRPVTISNSLIQENLIGVYVYRNTVAQIEGNRIVQNREGVILNGNGDSNPLPIITGNEIHTNSRYGSDLPLDGSNINGFGYLEPGIVLNATGNWWGTTSISSISQTIWGVDQEDGDGPTVDYSQYLDGPGGVPSSLPPLLGTITGNIELDTGTTYDVLSNLLIASDASLTIPAGTTLRFADKQLIVNGALTVQGTAEQPVVFTSPSATTAWYGIHINDGADAVVIDHAVIQYASYGIYLNDTGTRPVTISNSSIQDNWRGIHVYRDTVAQITNNRIINNDYGVYIDGSYDSNPQPVIIGNELHGNSSFNLYSEHYLSPDNILSVTGNWWGTTDESGIAATIGDAQDGGSGAWVSFVPYLDAPNGTLVGQSSLIGVITADLLLDEGATYDIPGNMLIAPGATLTIPGGTTLRFSNVAHGLNVSGSLILQGQEENPVILTSSSEAPDKGDWKGIQINAGAGAVVLEHAVVEYADIGVRLHDTGTRAVTIRNNLIQYCNDGIEVYRNTVAEITSNQIIRNTNGVKLNGNSDSNPQPVITGNELHTNSAYNIDSASYITPGIVVNATGNWWGTTSVSSIATAIRDHQDGGAAVRPFVDFAQYLDGPGGTTSGQQFLAGTLVENTTLIAGATYDVVNDVTVASGATLTIPAGTTLRFNNTGLQVNGTLTVAGSAGNEVVFTSSRATPAKGNWDGIQINAGAGAVVIEHAVVEYADNGIRLYDTGTRAVTIRDSLLQHNNDGVEVYRTTIAEISGNQIIRNTNGVNLNGNSDSNPQPVITGNELHTNSAYNVDSAGYVTPGIVVNATGNWWGTATLGNIASSIRDHQDGGVVVRPLLNIEYYLDGPGGTQSGELILTGTLAESRTLVEGATYDVVNDVTVASGVTLTVPEGTTLRFNNTGLQVDGSLIVEGTEGNEVVFTSSRTTLAKGNWEGIQINAGAGAVVIEHAVVQYARDGIRLNDTGERVVTIRNNLIQHNYNGIEVYRDTVAQITGNRIISNSRGVNLDGNSDSNPQPVITGNELHTNSQYNVDSAGYLTPGTVVNATGNWWGTASVDSIALKIRDQGDEGVGVRPFVDFAQYLDGPGGAPSGQLILTGTLVGNTTLVAGATYDVGLVVVAVDATLTIPAGTTLLFTDSDSGLSIDGALIIQGAAGNEVVFTSTSETPAKGNWKGIQINAGASAIVIEHALVQYADNGIRLNDTGARAITVRNNLIQFNKDGIEVYRNTVAQITDNRIVRNTNGVNLNGNSASNPQPVITGNELHTNSSYNIESASYQTPGTPVNATGNWWGTTSAVSIAQKIRDRQEGGARPSVDAANAAGGPLQAPILLSQTSDYFYISPVIEDEVQDSMTITGTLSESSNWTAQIRNLAGGVLKTFAGSATNQVVLNWDGTDEEGSPVNDGYYFVRVIATASADGARSGLAGLSNVTVDNTAPSADIDESAMSTVFQDVIQQDIVGSATDTNFAAYDLEYGVGAEPTSLMPVETGISAPKVNTILGTWIFGTDQGDSTKVRPNGDYTLSLTVTDKAGNVSVDTQPVTIDIVTLVNITQSTNQLDLSQNETVSVTFDLSLPGDVTLNIYDDLTGNLVRSVTVNFATAGTHTIPWDGRNDSLQPVVNEAYYYGLVAAGGARIGNYKLPRSGYPHSDWIPLPHTQSGKFSPLTNDHYIANFDLPTIARVRLRLPIIVNKTLNPLGVKGVPYLPGPGFIRWSGLVEHPGEEGFISRAFKAGLGYFPLPPDTVVISGSDAAPVIQGQSPYIEVKSDPYWIYMSYGQFTNIRYALQIPGGQNADVVIKILPPGEVDINDHSAIEIFNGQVGPGEHNVEWTGVDPQDATELRRTISESGAHVFAIQATAGGVTTVYKGAVNAYR